MNNNKKQSSKKDFNIEKELEFWNSYCYSEGSDLELIERFKKIRSQKMSKEDAKKISCYMENIVPIGKQPLFFLKVFLELPKKKCDISDELNNVIKQLCKNVFEKNNIDSTYFNSIGKEICCSKEPEIIVEKFIKKMQECIDKADYNDVDILALSYVWLVISCKNYRAHEYWKTTIVIEKVLVELFRIKEEKDIEKCIVNFIPKSIINATYKKQFLNLSYLYMDDRKKMMELEKNKSILEETIDNIILENNSHIKKIELLDEQVLELQNALSSSEEVCQQLKDEIVLKENMLKFETNKFEQQFISKQKNLMSEVNRVIGIEIEGIKGIADRLPEKERERILRYIRRIEERIVELGGEKNA